MSTKIIKLYNVLVDLKVDRAVAEQAIEPILAKEEAFQTLATKEDLHRQTKWIEQPLMYSSFANLPPIRSQTLLWIGKAYAVSLLWLDHVI